MNSTFDSSQVLDISLETDRRVFPSPFHPGAKRRLESSLNKNIFSFVLGEFGFVFYVALFLFLFFLNAWISKYILALFLKSRRNNNISRDSLAHTIKENTQEKNAAHTQSTFSAFCVRYELGRTDHLGTCVSICTTFHFFLSFFIHIFS